MNEVRVLKRKKRKEKYVYSLYKHEQIICVGTIREIAKWTGLEPMTIRKYATPYHRKHAKSAMFVEKVGESSEFE